MTPTRSNHILMGVLFAVLLFVVSFVMLWPHRHDVEEKAACEAKGGVFVEARQPLHVCVAPQ